MLWQNPDKEPTQPLDPQIRVIRVDDEAGMPRAVAVHYACHPVIQMHSGVISRDYPGAAVDYIEEQMGEGCMAMFLQGAEGDIDTYTVGASADSGRETARNAGISLGKAAVSQAQKAVPAEHQQNSLEVAEDMVNIPYRSGEGSTEACVVTAVINNEIALAAIPGEPFIQHQLNFADNSPVPHSMLLGLTHCGRGCPFLVYVPTEQAVKEGGYGATECSYVHPQAGKRMVDAVLAQIRTFVMD